MVKLLSQGGASAPPYPSHPEKDTCPVFAIHIESREKWNSKDSISIQLQDTKGSRMIELPIKGDDLDASELTWAITKALRQWNKMPV
jgi:hypothetical protein